MNKMFDNYKEAEITLFWTSEDKINRLIFAVTELIPSNQLPSEPLGGGSTKYLSNTIRSTPKLQVLCRRFFCSVDEAVYCIENSDWSTLENGPQDICLGQNMQREPAKGFSVVLSQGHVPLHINKPGLSMVLPNRSTSFRAFALLDNDNDTYSFFSKSERGKIVKFIKKYCGADLHIYGEFFGASIFCMQNPIIWKYKSFGVDDDQRLHLLLLLRDGQSINGMRYMIKMPHTFGISDAKIYNISSEIISLELPAKAIDPELYLWDKNGNLLEVNVLSFFGTIAGISSAHRKLPNGDTTAIWPTKYYKKRLKVKNNLEKYEEKRMYDLLEKKGEFFYFKAGENIKAQNKLGLLLAHAGINITICDMYLDAKGFDNFIKGWVRCESLTLFVSKNWLTGCDKHKTVCRKVDLESRITAMIVNKEIKSASLFCISGGNYNHGFVHDRFIIMDMNVYCIGASLNGFGDRDTVLFRSPNPAAFIDRVEEWKTASAKLLREWM